MTIVPGDFGITCTSFNQAAGGGFSGARNDLWHMVFPVWVAPKKWNDTLSYNTTYSTKRHPLKIDCNMYTGDGDNLKVEIHTDGNIGSAGWLVSDSVTTTSTSDTWSNGSLPVTIYTNDLPNNFLIDPLNTDSAYVLGVCLIRFSFYKDKEADTGYYRGFFIESINVQDYGDYDTDDYSAGITRATAGERLYSEDRNSSSFIIKDALINTLNNLMYYCMPQTCCPAYD